MAETVYDRHAQFYVDFVDRGRAAAETRGSDLILGRLKARLGEALRDARVCDLACGEGYLGRWLVRLGAREVVGIDLSQALIGVAKARADSERLSYFVGDAARLETVPDPVFDIVVCHMGLQDVADHRGLFAAARRSVKAGGRFVFTLLHPCFMAPCHQVEAPPMLLDGEGRPTAIVARRYASEGYWNSGGDGVRGRMGSHHRMIATYVNDLVASGFRLEAMEEILAGDNDSGEGLAAEIPTVLLVAAKAVGGAPM
jgi:SAM-dependent methyltransferase